LAVGHPWISEYGARIRAIVREAGVPGVELRYALLVSATEAAHQAIEPCFIVLNATHVSLLVTARGRWKHVFEGLHARLHVLSVEVVRGRAVLVVVGGRPLSSLPDEDVDATEVVIHLGVHPLRGVLKLGDTDLSSQKLGPNATGKLVGGVLAMDPVVPVTY